MSTHSAVRDRATAPPRTGAASTALRPVLDGPRREGRVIASFPVACYVELSGAAEPRVVALITSDAVRLPNALLLAGTPPPPVGFRVGTPAQVSGGRLTVGPVTIGARRWWNPTPALGIVPADRVSHALGLMRETVQASGRRTGLAEHDGPAELAALIQSASRTAGALPDAVEAAERIVGLGPGLTPSGDDVLAGMLLALRLLGGAVPGGAPAVWLADWISAAVTHDATLRTTSLSATLLRCAAAGQAGAETAAVLRAVAGHGIPPAVATTRLLACGHTSGADLMWGLLAGCRAVLNLATAGGDTGPDGAAPRPTTRTR